MITVITGVHSENQTIAWPLLFCWLPWPRWDFYVRACGKRIQQAAKSVAIATPTNFAAAGVTCANCAFVCMYLLPFSFAWLFPKCPQQLHVLPREQWLLVHLRTEDSSLSILHLIDSEMKCSGGWRRISAQAATTATRSVCCVQMQGMWWDQYIRDSKLISTTAFSSWAQCCTTLRRLPGVREDILQGLLHVSPPAARYWDNIDYCGLY